MIDADLLADLEIWADARDWSVDAIVVGAEGAGTIVACYDPRGGEPSYLAARLSRAAFGEPGEWFIRDLAVKYSQADAFAAMAEL